MSNRKFKDIQFKNVETNKEELIRVFESIDEELLNKKILDFLGGTNYDQDKFTMHTLTGSRIHVKELYSARPEDQPINVNLVSSAQFRSANFLIKGEKQRLKFVFGKTVDLNSSLVAKAGGVWSNGDRVLIRSNKPSADIITPSYLVNPKIILDYDDQPYRLELLPSNHQDYFDWDYWFKLFSFDSNSKLHKNKDV